MTPHAIDIESVHLSHREVQPTPMIKASTASRVSPKVQGLLQKSGSPDETYDFIGVGFGPSNLALAIALHDALENQSTVAGAQRRTPRVLFLERQADFGWHRGMLIPGAKMQISFIKDLATMRNPRSHFTFINYLHEKNRLASFTNLSTFLPRRQEFEDYMRWCADHFEDIVEYGQEVASITPSVQRVSPHDTVDAFSVVSRDVHTGAIHNLKARKVVIAAGGSPSIPKSLRTDDHRLIHSSQYLTNIGNILPDKTKEYTIAVVGGGQSSAEIFNDLQSRYPASKTRLIIRGAALKPSDDSPFVNEIFDPERVDGFYKDPADKRAEAVMDNKPTNYGVVRPELLERIYETMYMQKFDDPDERQWQHRILAHRSADGVSSSAKKLTLKMSTDRGEIEELQVDAVIVAVGYARNAYEHMLASMEHLRPEESNSKWAVRRDYGVELDSTKVDKDCGIYLSGCNESTHGLSDSLLSILANRGGELVDTMFGDLR